MDQTNFTMNAAFAPEDTYSLDFHPLEILNAVTSVVSALANALIIFVIVRYSVMRTRPNVYLANWCICNFIVMLLVPVAFNMFGLVDSVDYEFQCAWEQALHGVLFGNMLFVVIVLLDWYIVTYTKATCVIRCKQIHLFVTALVWIVIISVTVASITFCMLDRSYPLSLVCDIFGYLLIFIVIVVVSVLCCVKIKIFRETVAKSKLELIIVSSYFLCWLPNWMARYGQLFMGFAFNSISVEHFASFAGYSHAWIMLIVLYFCDKSFCIYLRRTFGAKDDSIDDNIVNKEQSTVLL